MKARIIERTVKDGGSNNTSNQVIKYTIKGCETEKVKVNSSGYYVFGDKSFSKGVWDASNSWEREYMDF